MRACNEDALLARGFMMGRNVGVGGGDAVKNKVDLEEIPRDENQQ